MTLSASDRLGRYEILGPLGAGGMGEVYRARDTELEREVAIKVLPEAVAQNPDRLERFRREAKAVAKLAHPNILEIWDFGTEGDTTYSVTELLEGETLRERLEGGTLGWRKATEIGAAIADGLAAAHEAGIVHRDLKPSNVFLTADSRVKVLDFGLARHDSLEQEEGATHAPTLTKHTDPGTVLGTVGYMAPEQVKGRPADARSDIFSLGCVLYEMVSGQRAFARDTAVETMNAILKEEPADISTSGEALPPELAGTVRRCLEKKPQSRFQSASDLAFALRSMSAAQTIQAVSSDEVALRPRRRLGLWISVAAATLVVASVALWLYYRSGSVGEPAVKALPRIAVLPFENLGSPDDEYFADGMTDEVRGRLFNLAGLEVIARYSSDQYRGSTKTLDQIAEELGARYLLTAKVRWQKGGDGSSRIRVSPELVVVEPNVAPVAMWHDVFDANLADVFQVQDDIATRVARALDVTLSAGEEKALESRPTDNLAAYDAFLQAERIEREGAGGDLYSRVTELYRKAVALDPGFALAWAKLSMMESEYYRMFALTAQKAESARRAAERALELDPSLPEARFAMAVYLFDVEYDMEGANEQIALVFETAPNHPLLRDWWAVIHLSWQDRPAYSERAAELDPLSWTASSAAGFVFLWARQYRKAQEWFDRAISLAAPTNVFEVENRAMVFLAQGDLEGARTFVREAAERVDVTELVARFACNWDLYWVLDDDWQELMFRLGPEQFVGYGTFRSLAFAHTHHLRGEWDQMRADAEIARAEFARELESLPNDPHVHISLGSALAYLGRGDEAVTHGRRGLELLPDDWFEKPYWQLQLVRIHVILGQPEPALDLLEPLLEVPFYLSPGWLSIDPMFDPLRDQPRFQALLEEYATN